MTRNKTVIKLFIFICLFSFTHMTANAEENKPSFEKYLETELTSYATEIDITEYVMENGWDEKQTMTECVNALVHSPVTFHVAGSYLALPPGKAKIVNISYSMPKEEYKSKINSIDNEISNILTSAADLELKTDREKALLIHDFLAVNLTYEKKKKNIYDAVIGKQADCVGYSRAYKYIAQKLGMECELIISLNLWHMWNYVKIGGAWYHVDSTRDDPVTASGDLWGGAQHGHFLVSDSKKMELEGITEPEWDTRGLPPADSDKYDGYFWENVKTGMFKIKDSWYWLEYKNKPGEIVSLLKKLNVKENKISTVYSFPSIWYTHETKDLIIKKHWKESFSRLGEYGGKLYFNTASEIYSFNAETKEIELVSRPADLDGSIYGLVVKDNQIVYTVKQSYEDEDKLSTITIE